MAGPPRIFLLVGGLLCGAAVVLAGSTGVALLADDPPRAICLVDGREMPCVNPGLPKEVRERVERLLAGSLEKRGTTTYYSLDDTDLTLGSGGVHYDESHPSLWDDRVLLAPISAANCVSDLLPLEGGCR